MTPTQREAALRLADWLHTSGVVNSEVKEIIALLRELVAEPANPAPGYCKHCKQYTIEEPLPAEPVRECADNDSPWLICKPCAPTYTEQQIADACMAAEVPDSKCESVLLALRA